MTSEFECTTMFFHFMAICWMFIFSIFYWFPSINDNHCAFWHPFINRFVPFPCVLYYLFVCLPFCDMLLLSSFWWHSEHRRMIDQYMSWMLVVLFRFFPAHDHFCCCVPTYWYFVFLVTCELFLDQFYLYSFWICHFRNSMEHNSCSFSSLTVVYHIALCEVQTCFSCF